MTDPWYKTSFTYSPLGRELKVRVPHDVFSTQRIDEGTLLLLESLPSAAVESKSPKKILDVGCGYGALGLPIAARFPEAQLDLIDRDLLAVHYSAENARENELTNVHAFGSLGFQSESLQKAQPTYDWILCNVPARIGTPFIETLITEGRQRLTPGGELRVVVIRDLGPVLLELKEKHQWPLTESARGPRHVVFSINADSPKEASPPKTSEALYLRDQVQIQDSLTGHQLLLDRPFDLGGDDQKRLRSGLPVFIDALPRSSAPHTILCFRCGYGALPLLARTRWPEAQVVAVDRDLLATTFTRHNAARLNLGGEKLDVRENYHFPNVIAPTEHFDLILGELSPSADRAVALAEMHAIEAILAPGGQALILSLDKLNDWIQAFSEKSKLGIHKVLTREGYTVTRLSK